MAPMALIRDRGLDLHARIQGVLRQRPHQYCGVLAPNAHRRTAITAFSWSRDTGMEFSERAAATAPEPIMRSPARHLRVMPSARIFRARSLAYPGAWPICDSSQTLPRRCTFGASVGIRANPPARPTQPRGGTGVAPRGRPSIPSSGLRAASAPNLCRRRATSGRSPVTAPATRLMLPQVPNLRQIGACSSSSCQSVAHRQSVSCEASRRTNHSTPIAVRPASAPRLTPIGPLPPDVPSP